MVQYKEINQSNPLYIQTQRKKIHDRFIRCWESIWQNPTFFHEIRFGKWGIQGPYLNTVKAIYNKPIANINLNGEKLESNPVQSRTRHGCHSFHNYSI